MLCNRWTMLELRAQLEADPSSSQRGGAEALRAKLQFVEDRVYSASDGLLADEQQQWLKVEKDRLLANGLCQSVYLAVPAARLYLRELYFVLAEKRSWGSKVKISRAAKSDVKWWSRLPVMSKWNGRRIWRPATRAKLHTDSSMTAWGGVINLKHAAIGLPVSYFAAQLKSYSVTSKTPKVTVGTRLEIFWVDDDKFYPGSVKSFNKDGTAHVVYDDGDEETLNLSEEKFNILHSAGVYKQNSETAEVLNENMERGGDYKENKCGGDYKENKRGDAATVAAELNAE
ncbi:hypothetical protein CYMTET_41758 [Cymbomonas tetramitiformis]|uniref:Tudor domain-containing protein n=1 Tax=Cymbomonas tetramitiformis TaxID=36881 RepID=A0AAE0F1N6_9CHLO|nr:hypothetical protein CYMTET_41758 [Cymbomonas tetramitiformis]